MTELKSLLHYDALIRDSTRRSDLFNGSTTSSLRMRIIRDSLKEKKRIGGWREIWNAQSRLRTVVLGLCGETGRNASCCLSRLCICRVICTWRKGYWDAERIKFMGEGEETSPQSRKKLWKAAFRFRRNELWWPANYTRLQTMTMPLLTLRHKWILVSFHEVWHDHRQTRLTVASES